MRKIVEKAVYRNIVEGINIYSTKEVCTTRTRSHAVIVLCVGRLFTKARGWVLNVLVWGNPYFPSSLAPWRPRENFWGPTVL
jgi:hypothetical protein